MAPSFHPFRTAARDEFTWNPRLIRWYFAYSTCEVSTNVDLAAEARGRANYRKGRHPTDVDDPSLSKNIISDPQASVGETNGLGRDDYHDGPLRQSVPTRPLFPITSRDCDKMSRFELVEPAIEGGGMQSACRTLREKHPLGFPTAHLADAFRGGGQRRSNFDNNLTTREARTA